ncbi:MAG: hypothetical protein VX519_01245, partial [Myxococcota bacterium]|nr:hypothetical protein [Myxococcota bacterium]
MLLNLLLLKSATAATLTVGGTGTFSSIQAAIDASIPGDTIEVAAGFYTESLNLSGKDLDIMGVSGSGQTTIQSPLNNISVAWNLGESGSFQGFTIRPNSARAMSMTSASVVVSDVVIEGGGSLGTIDGGAVHITGGAPTFSDVEVRDSQGRLGGAFYMETQANVAISDLLIEDTAATFGGAFYLS